MKINAKRTYAGIGIITLLVLLLYFAVPMQDRVFVLFDDVAELMAFILATVFLTIASNYVLGLEKKSITLMSIGFGFWTLGQLVWSIFNFTHSNAEVPTPYFSDIGFISFYIFVIYGLFVLIQHYSHFISKRQWIIAVFTFVILTGIALPLVLIPALRSSDLTPLGKLVTIIYPILDIVIVSLLTIISNLTAGGEIGQAWILTGAGFFILTWADLVFTYLTTLQLGSMYVVSKFGVLWTLAGLVVMAGSVKYIEAHV
jgi:hypothetical protein